MLEEIFPVYIARLATPLSHTFSTVHVQPMWMNASMNRRELDWRNCTFYTNHLYLFKNKNHSILNTSCSYYNNP